MNGPRITRRRMPAATAGDIAIGGGTLSRQIETHAAHDSGRRRACLGAATLLIATVMPVRAQKTPEADPAVLPIRAFYDALLSAMKQANQLGLRGRYDKLAPVIRSTFDLPAMTRIAVGPEWNSIATGEQSALVDAFTRMTIATYANRFNGYSGESFEVDPEVQSRNTGKIVRTRLIRTKEEPVTLNYLMRGSADSWKVVDVYLSGTISELATQRSEFAAILKSGGPPALVESLRQHSEKLMGKS